MTATKGERVAAAVVNAVIAVLGCIVVVIAGGPTWAAVSVPVVLFTIATASDDVIREIRKRTQGMVPEAELHEAERKVRAWELAAGCTSGYCGWDPAAGDPHTCPDKEGRL